MQKQKDFIICNNDSGSSTDNNLIDSNNNGLDLANKYAKPRPKSADRFLSRGNRDINAIKRNPNNVMFNYNYNTDTNRLVPSVLLEHIQERYNKRAGQSRSQGEGQLLCFGANGTPNLTNISFATPQEYGPIRVFP